MSRMMRLGAALAVLSSLAGCGGDDQGRPRRVSVPVSGTFRAEMDRGARAYRTGRIELALEHFRKAYQSAAHPVAAYNVATCSLELGRLDDCRTWLRRVDRRNADWHILAIRLAWRSGRKKEVDSLVAALRGVRASPPRWVFLCDYLRERGEVEAGLEVALTALKSHPTDAGLLVRWIRLLSLLGRMGDSLRACDEALGRNPRSNDVVAERIRVLGEMGRAVDLERTAAELEKASSPDSLVMAALARSWIDLAAAVRVAERVSASHPLHVGAALLAGNLLLRSGRPDLASARLKGLAQSVHSERARYYVAVHERRDRDTERHLENVARRTRGSMWLWAHCRMAELLARRNDYEKGLGTLAAMERSHAGRAEALQKVLATRGEVLMRRGEYAQAGALFERAARVFPYLTAARGRALLARASCLTGLGRGRQAQDLLQRVAGDRLVSSAHRDRARFWIGFFGAVPGTGTRRRRLAARAENPLSIGGIALDFLWSRIDRVEMKQRLRRSHYLTERWLHLFLAAGELMNGKNPAARLERALAARRGWKLRPALLKRRR